MSLDTLTVSSRSFYERTKAKVALSILTAGFALMLLGFTSSSAGESQAAYYAGKDLSGDAANEQDSYRGGYGFAAFCYILAFILLLTASIYISPLLVGSANEKKMIRAPQEIDTGYSAYQENNASAPQV